MARTLFQVNSVKNWKQACAYLAALCWLMLVCNTMYIVQEQVSSTELQRNLLNSALSTVFVVAVFLYHRFHYSIVRNTDIIQYLLRLLVFGGVTGLGSLVMYVGYIMLTRHYYGPNQYLLNLVHLVFYAAMVLFFARAFSAWKRMILFHINKHIVTEWEWFEILLGITLLVKLIPVKGLDFLFYPLLVLMLVYALVISLHLKWVAFLSIRKKWQSIFILLGLLLVSLGFILYFADIAGHKQLALDPSRHPFYLVLAFFIFLYCLLSLLVSLFNLPTTEVFEQKRDDILSFQRLSQSIQMGKDEQQVYQTLFESAIKAAQADGGWLEINTADQKEVRHRLHISDEEIAALRYLAERFNIGEIDYLNNELNNEEVILQLQSEYRSYVKLILRSQQVHYATLYLVKEIAQGFDREQLTVLHTFISQTLVTIDNFRLVAESIENEQYKKELNIAARMQDSLLPKDLPGNMPFEISIFSCPAKEVGGDFYDFHEISEDRLAVLIGDVSGKGISAAFNMAQMKGIFQALMQLELLPDQFMIYANAALSFSLERSTFITASVYFIDYKMKGLSFARAGHCHTLYHNCSTGDTFYFQTDGLGLGIVRNERYEKLIKRVHYDYNTNDIMVLYTDGITEARNAEGDEFGVERLQRLLAQNHAKSAVQIKEAIVQDLNLFSKASLPYDDQTLLVIKFK